LESRGKEKKREKRNTEEERFRGRDWQGHRKAEGDIERE
jgi:hypothetical protein